MAQKLKKRCFRVPKVLSWGFEWHPLAIAPLHGNFSLEMIFWHFPIFDHKNDVPPRKLVDGNSPSENRKLRPRNLS